MRQPDITIRYLDEDLKEHKEQFTGVNARVIQHEYDHINGILFIDHLKPLKKKLLKRKLEAIRKGNIDPDYRMRYAALK